MTLDQFQQNRLEKHFKENAALDLIVRRQERKMTIGGAYKWIESRIKRLIEDGEVKPDNHGCIVGDDDWVYAEMMYYFANCEEGDTYKTPEEIKEEEERQKEETERRNEKAKEKWEEHRKRLAEWKDKTPEEIKQLIYIQKHPWKKDKTSEELAQDIKSDEEFKRKQEERQRKEEEKRRKEELKKKLENAQMSLF